jgi:uncharacterized protein (TIGR00730 family)
MRICLFASSSDAAAPAYRAAAAELGRLLGGARHELVFGGGNVGLMGETARAAKAAGGRVTGVIVEFMVRAGVAFGGADTMEVARTMAERKVRMEELADAFVALPGGFGTLDELAEVITLCQLGLMDKPIAVLNVEGFYDELASFFDRLVRDRLAKPEFRDIVGFCASPEATLRYLAEWRPVARPKKWF